MSDKPTAAGHPGQSAYLPSPQASIPIFSDVSNGLLIPMRAFDVICRYTSVEFGLRCPKSCWMNVWLIPSSREWQAKQCRRVCGVTPSGRPSFRAWPLTKISTASGVSGASLTVLGNSHPLGRPYRYQYSVRISRLRSLRIVYRSCLFFDSGTWIIFCDLRISS